MSVVRCILHCDDENLVLAARAVQFMLNNPERKEAYLLYGNEDDTSTKRVSMFAKRLKKSIRVLQASP